MENYIGWVVRQKLYVIKLSSIVVITTVICVLLHSSWVSPHQEEIDLNYLEKTPLVGEEVEIEQVPIAATTPKRPNFHSFLVTANPLKKTFYDGLPVLRADPATNGGTWPLPSTMFTENKVLIVQGEKVEFVIRGKSCGVLERALQRHSQLFQQLFISTELPSSDKSKDRKEVLQFPALTKIDIVVMQECTAYPHIDMDESYELVLSDKPKLEANQVWGVLRGLETLHQLVHRNATISSDTADTFVVLQGTIQDKPRYPHRGILIDSSRHFLKKETILQNLEAMSQVKFNVLHWHLIDDQSFPFESKVFPDLTLKGAYKDHRGKPVYYTHEDIMEIVDFARDRGIRVMPEFDTPGHTESWEGGMPEILSDCPGRRFSNRPGPIDPTKNITFFKLKLFFQEIIQLFPEKYLHLGGDECPYFCWSTSPRIAAFMTANGMIDYEELFRYYVERLVKIIDEIDTNTVPVFWQEVYDEGAKLPPKSVIHFWKSDLFSLPFKNVTRSGHKIIFSSCWYLNYVKYGTDWQTYYICDPGVFANEAYEYVLGGEACMWGEYVDDTNLLQYLWPRAIAVAERLWTPSSNINFFESPARFEEQRCRFIRRGIPAAPQLGPEPPCF